MEKRILRFLLTVTIILFTGAIHTFAEPMFWSTEIFPLLEEEYHAHSASIVELPNGDLLAAWFQGSRGERKADDGAIWGARLRVGDTEWTAPFIMADVPGFPDINPVLFVDGQERLWLIWYTVLANVWESSLPKYRISENYMMPDGSPEWMWQEVLHVKVGDPFGEGLSPEDSFVKAIDEKMDDYIAYHIGLDGYTEEHKPEFEAAKEELLAKASGQALTLAPGVPSFRRLGWQTQNKPVILDTGRLIIPLYSDGFSFSVMAITDDCGETWEYSEPLVGLGNIQPTLAQKADGTLVAFMRDNGPPPKRIHFSESKDGGLTWGPVRYTELPNPGSAIDIVTLQGGEWLLVYNDLDDSRHRLAVSLSDDEGETWKWTRYIEIDTREPDPSLRRGGLTYFHYPSVIEGNDGTIHVVYSHHLNGVPGPQRNIKYARFNLEWLKMGQ